MMNSAISTVAFNNQTDDSFKLDIEFIEMTNYFKRLQEQEYPKRPIKKEKKSKWNSDLLHQTHIDIEFIEITDYFKGPSKK